MSAIAQATNPIIRWEWVVDEWDQIRAALVEHIELTMLSVGLGVLVAAVLSVIALRYRPLASPITSFTGVLYTIPSVALFGLLVPVLGLGRTAAVLPLAAYTLLMLVTNTIAGFDAVPASVRDAADGMGLTPRQRVMSVELPIALPYMIAGLRMAVVSTVGLVTVAAIIGQGGLGRLILNGLRRTFWTPMTVGAVLSVLLALALDALIFFLARLATPWVRRGNAA